MVFYFFIAPHNTQNHFSSSDGRLCAYGRRLKTFARLYLGTAKALASTAGWSTRCIVSVCVSVCVTFSRICRPEPSPPLPHEPLLNPSAEQLISTHVQGELSLVPTRHSSAKGLATSTGALRIRIAELEAAADERVAVCVFDVSEAQNTHSKLKPT
jgi:hypothetical protein